MKDGRDSASPEGGGRTPGRLGPGEKAIKKPNPIDAPMAIASDGMLLINLTHLDGSGDVLGDARRLMAEGHAVFIGVALGPELRRVVVRDLDDALADVVGRVGARLRRSGRR
jgi:hypothetical protein